MVAAFQDSWHTGDPDDDEFALEFCKPTWGEVQCPVSAVSPFQPPPPPGQQQAVPVQYVFWITLPAADAPALTAVTTAVTGPQRPPGPPTASAATSALTISVGRTWVLAGFATRFTGRQFEAALPSRNQALQLQRILAASD